MGEEGIGSASTLQHSDNATGIAIDFNRKVKLLTLEEERVERPTPSGCRHVCVSCAAVDNNISLRQQKTFTREDKHGGSSFLQRMLLG